MNLASYYTTANRIGYKTENPRVSYINLTQVGDWIKTTVIIGGQVVSIPRWLLLDHLSIEQALDPGRKSERVKKDRLIVRPALTRMMADRGFRFGTHMNTYIPKPKLTVKDFRELGYADTMRLELQEGSITESEVVKKVMESFFEVRPTYSNDTDAVDACMDKYGWNWFEFQAAWWLYHREANQWVAHNDPAEK